MGVTPLHLACMRGHVNITNQLLANNASVDAATWLPEDAANSAMHAAVKDGHAPFHLLDLMRGKLRSLVSSHSLQGSRATYVQTSLIGCLESLIGC
jgi:ankyrin repeat protein